MAAVSTDVKIVLVALNAPATRRVFKKKINVIFRGQKASLKTLARASDLDRMEKLALNSMETHSSIHFKISSKISFKTFFKIFSE